MKIEYLNELLTAKCEDVADTIAEIRRAGALPDAMSRKVAGLTDNMVRLCADWFRVVPPEGYDGFAMKRGDDA